MAGMSRAEQDDLRRQEVAALTALADRLPAAVEDRPVEKRWHGIPPLEPLFVGERGGVLLLRSIPGFAGLWARSVPQDRIVDTHDREGLRWSVVTCSCGGTIVVRVGALGDCSCGRWFFHVGSSIRWRDFANDDAPEAA